MIITLIDGRVILCCNLIPLVKRKQFGPIVFKTSMCSISLEDRMRYAIMRIATEHNTGLSRSSYYTALEPLSSKVTPSNQFISESEIEL